MNKFKKRNLAMFLVFCMTVASIPQAIFATDYDNHWAKNSIAKWSEKGLVVGYEDGTFYNVPYKVDTYKEGNPI